MSRRPKVHYVIGGKEFTGILWNTDADTFEESDRLEVGYDPVGENPTSNVISIWRVANQAKLIEVAPPVVEVPPTDDEPPVEDPPVEEEPPVEEPPAADDEVTTVAEMQAAARGGAGKVYAIRGNFGRVDLSGIRPSSEVTFVGVPGDHLIRQLFFQGSANLRFQAVRLGGASETERVDPRALFDVADTCQNLALIDSELAYTLARNNGNQGYAIRAVNGNSPIIDGLEVRGCYLHHIGADGFQLAGVAGLVVDRCELAYICQEPGSSEHSDSLQIMSLAGPATITNNYIHHHGYFNEQHQPQDGYGAGQLLVHGWNHQPVRFENNLIRECRNYHPMFKEENNGSVASGWEFVRNTIIRCGPPQPGRDNSGVWRGQHEFEANLFSRPSGTPGSEALPADVRWNEDWSSANYPGRGYRKPAGVRW